jgi:hypothetical protein
LQVCDQTLIYREKKTFVGTKELGFVIAGMEHIKSGHPLRLKQNGIELLEDFPEIEMKFEYAG